MFEVRLGVISIFDNDRFDVVKVEALGSGLHKFNSLLASNLYYSQMYKTYSPHITIAYIKKGTCRNLIGNEIFKDKTWKASSIIFSSRNRTKTKIPLKLTTIS
jgi:2'-5' RNA ligase